MCFVFVSTSCTRQFQICRHANTQEVNQSKCAFIMLLYELAFCAMRDARLFDILPNLNNVYVLFLLYEADRQHAACNIKLQLWHLDAFNQVLVRDQFKTVAS